MATTKRKKNTSQPATKSTKKSTKPKATSAKPKATTKKKKKEEKREPFPCFGSYDGEDSNCEKCPDEEACIEESETLEEELEEEEEDESEESDEDIEEEDEDIEEEDEDEEEEDDEEEEEFDPESLDLEDDEERLQILSELTDDELWTVAEHYEVDVDDESERSELLLAIDAFFDEESEEDEDEEEDDEDYDEEEEDDEDIEEEEEEDEEPDEDMGEGEEDETTPPDDAEEVLQILVGTVKTMRSLFADGSTALKIVEQKLEDLGYASDETEPEPPEVDEEEEDENVEELEEPDYFRPFMEKKKYKIVQAADNKLIAKDGMTHMASLYYKKDGTCLLVFNNGQLSRLPGAKKLKDWDNHPYVKADDENAKKLLIRHIKIKSQS